MLWKEYDCLMFEVLSFSEWKCEFWLIMLLISMLSVGVCMFLLGIGMLVCRLRLLVRCGLLVMLLSLMLKFEKIVICLWYGVSGLRLGGIV